MDRNIKNFINRVPQDRIDIISILRTAIGIMMPALALAGTASADIGLPTGPHQMPGRLEASGTHSYTQEID